MRKRWRSSALFRVQSASRAGSLHMCDTMCRKEGFKFYQLVGHCERRGRESSYDQLVQAVLQWLAAETRLSDERRASKWREMVVQKAFREAGVWAAFGMEQFVHEKLWESFTQKKKAWARSVLAEVEKERQNGTDGDWQQETPYKEELELCQAQQ